MKKLRLTKDEKQIEDALVRGEYIDIGKKELENIALAIASRKKDSVLNIRVNNEDVRLLKDKARKFGVKYQTLVSELLHRIAHS